MSEKKTILITGCLGYLGTELCKLYSGESWFHKIIGIDDKFFSNRVNQLRKWNIEFHQIKILDKNRLKSICQNVDIIHHLAGITDVAYVKSDIDKKKEKEIIEVGIHGTNNILESADKKCKIIFPSTHVIFEGLRKTKKEITETEKPKPILTYAKTKLQNELDIIKSKLNYVILRLGSVYGYSDDNTRMNIMPNLFSKISALNGAINLFSGGRQLKSLVSVYDVARCFKFMEINNINNQIFNLSNENTTVKGVAQILKKINPKLTIQMTNDAVPNRGYTLSNKKILKYKFKFLFNLKNSLKDMYEKWSAKDKFVNKLEYASKGNKEYIDYRGKISNYELSEPINLIGHITSKKNTIRANHYHPVQEQKVLLIKGQYISVYQDLMSENKLKTTHLINENECIVTKPNVAHTMIFTKDSTLLNLVRGEREHKNYGISHTIPYLLVTEKEKKIILRGYRFNCRCCDSKNLKRIISFGFQAPANNLLDRKEQKFTTYPLELNYCVDCYNCQLSYVVKPEKLFSNYLYLSSTSITFRKHFEKAANKYIKEFRLKKNKSIIIDIGSNDGIGLIPFKKGGFKKIVGIEPAKNIAILARKNGIKTINSFMNRSVLKKIKKKADLILASNVYAHTDNLNEMTETIFKLLKKNGTLIIEVQYIINTIKDLSFDNIYHEHVNYWNITTLKKYLSKFSFEIYKVEKIDTHGGSIRVFVSKKKTHKIDKSVKRFEEYEKNFGIHKFKKFENFQTKIYELKSNFIKNLKKLTSEKKIAGYGAPAKASTMLNFFGVKNQIKFIIDDNKFKNKKIIPGTEIQIFNKENIPFLPDQIIIFAWNYYKEIKKNNKNICKNFINIQKMQRRLENRKNINTLN
jgi:nucleoside-diphosphate-sugar epimerase/SAM-dependent methyltransferase